MTNFWDLPKPVRQKIYRFHLLRDEPISNEEHSEIATHRAGGGKYLYQQRQMPALLAISKKADKEAAVIYYGENHFLFDPVVRACGFAAECYPRHLRMIRRVTCEWSGVLACEGFLAIRRMRGLQELYIRVNEGSMVRESLSTRHERQSHRYFIPNEEITPQQQLCLFRYSGMSTLLTLSNIPHVEFTKIERESSSGLLPGGFLETVVLPRLRGTKPRPFQSTGLEEDAFPFLSLPPEIRNRIYGLLLRIDGRIHPSTQRPSSTQKKIANRAFTTPTPESALSLLAVNKQVHNEAFGIFYHCNAFEFYYPTQLHAFLLGIGEERQKYLRDLTVHYYNYKVGGIDIAELTFPLLKQLTGLRRLQIYLDMGIHKLIHSNYISSNGTGWNITKANPMQLPGIKSLFSLRGLTEIKLTCRDLEKDFEAAKKDSEYPNFTAKSKKACVVMLIQVFKHFNKALADAQKGKVNKKMLEDPEWHTKDVFATIDDETMDES